MLLSGNQSLYTDDITASYKVVKGSAQVFLAPANNEGGMRRLHLLNAREGTVIPHLNFSWSVANKKTIMRLLIVGNPAAEIEKIPAELEHDEAFLKAANIPYYDVLSPELLTDTLLHLYAKWDVNEMNIVSDISKRREAQSRQSYSKMTSSFEERRLDKYLKEANTASPLYNAVAFACTMGGLPLSTLANVKKLRGDNFSVADIARLSGFVSREVQLPANWASEDMKPFIVLFGEEQVPLACYRYRGKTRYWNAVTGEEGVLKQILKKPEESTIIVLSKPLAPGKASAKDILKFAFSEVRVLDIITYFGAMFLSTFVTLQMTILTERLYNQIIPQGEMKTVFGVALYILAFTIGGLMFNVSRSLTNFRISSCIKYALYAACYDRLFHMENAYFKESSVAEIAFRMESMPSIFVSMLTSALQMIGTVVFSFVYLSRMLSYSKLMTGYAVLFVAITMVFSVVLGLIGQKLTMKRSNFNTKVRGLLLQVFSGIETIRNYGAEDDFANRFMDTYADYSKVVLKSDAFTRLQTMIISGTGSAALVAFYLLMGIGKTDVSTGIFLAFISAYSAYAASMNGVAGNLLLFIMMRPMLKQTSDIFAKVPETATQGTMPDKITGAIEISNVFYTYPNSPAPTLNDINISIKAGQYVAIVGPSGCGKSTLLRLLLGFNKTTKGKIYYDGVDIDRINKVELRRKIGTVLQDGALFTGSIYKNISISCPDIDEQSVLEAVEAAGLTETIQQMPLGLSTPVSEESGSISGGQKQRIMIARAIVGKPKILFMDEATSALDNITQAAIQKNLDELKATRVIIAHRLSTVRNCDVIYVMDRGRIVESGSYKELMEKKGAFYTLVKKQVL